MEQSSNDELSLNGVLQFDTAIAALHAVDVNPSATERLETIRSVQKELASAAPDQPEAIALYLKGGSTAAMKADILVGLELLSSTAPTPEQKIAAQALLETMTQ